MISASQIKPSVEKAIAAIKGKAGPLPQAIETGLKTQPFAKVLASLQEYHRQIHATVFQLAVEQLGGHSLLENARYALLLLGSGARGEQLLSSDQDHAFIYDTADANKRSQVEWEQYFQRLGETFAALLHEVGYPLCTGNVMMSNRRWRGSVADWEERIGNYSNYPDWDNIRYLLIAADTGLVAGDSVLARGLQRLVVGSVARSPFICWKIADQGLAQRTQTLPFAGWLERFGDISFSIKEKFYTPLVNSVRLWALSVDIEEVATEKRIDQLLTKKVWTEELAAEILLAFDLALRLRLKNQLGRALAKQPITDELEVAALSDNEKEELKCALRSVKKLQQLTARHFPRPR